MDIEKTLKKVSDYCDYKFGETNTKYTYCTALKSFLSKFPNVYNLKDISDEKILEYLLAIPGRSNRCNHHSAIKLMYRVHGFKQKMRFMCLYIKNNCMFVSQSVMKNIIKAHHHYTALCDSRRTDCLCIV